MDDDLKLAIPVKLDDPPKFLWWDFDVAMIFMFGVIFGLVTQFALLGVVIGLFAAYGYQKTKQGKHKAFAIHFLYWKFGISMGVKSMPPSYVREFKGK